MDPEEVLTGLDDNQRTAATAVSGPVCILAGAGTGKTRTITHRIAYGVLAGAFPPGQVLAVTFTTRAAGEMRARLRGLGAAGIQARTFHSAALRQLQYFWPRIGGGNPFPTLVDRKATLVAQAAHHCGMRPDRTLVRDLTAEVEWAKATLAGPDTYPAAAEKGNRQPPVEADRVAGVYATYEQLKQKAGVLDFDDLLLVMAGALEEQPAVAAEVRGRYRHFVVDEYQDVNPLQQRLLAGWLGDRDELCVVGDASQTIYSFTGASPHHLVEFRRGYPDATLVRLERDYRSTPQVVGLANKVIGSAQGALAKVRLRLVGVREPGPEPALTGYDDEPAEAAAVAARCQALIAAGTPASEIAVLFRTNAQSEAYEAALADADVPYQVRGGERFFERPEIRQAMTLLRGAARSSDDQPLVEAVTAALSGAGYTGVAPPGGGAARERHEALAALVRLAEDSAAAGRTLPDLVAELTERAAAQHAPTVEGVTLASLHAAKGLEWDAVFLVGLSEGMLPITHADTAEQVEEERRLLYVGITRARVHLALSWALARSPGGRRTRHPSRFLASLLPESEAEKVAPRQKRERKLPTCRTCGAVLRDGKERKLGRCATCPSTMDEELYERLREWRIARAKAAGLPAYTVFTDATLMALAEQLPGDTAELVRIPGIGQVKLDQYGVEVLAIIAGEDPPRTS
jgi:DNA helicase-2/ATP-dependent DNA helicase PcrA